MKSPIIGSNVASIPEVVGSAGVLVDPYKVKAISEAMIEIWRDDSKRKQLINAGKQQAQKFSWDVATEVIYNSIQKALEKPESD